MGISLSVVDFRLLFEDIDFNDEGSVDYFKFCLLDSDKQEFRENLKKQFKANQLLKLEVSTQLKSPAVKDKLKPKNKDPTSFLAQINEQRFTQQLLKRRKKIQDKFERLENASKLEGQGHVYGISNELEHPSHFKKLLEHQFTELLSARELDLQEAKYKPELINKTLKPPKPTKSSLIRQKLTSYNSVPSIFQNNR